MYQHVAQIYQIMFVLMSVICKIAINFMSEFHMISFKRIDSASPMTVQFFFEKCSFSDEVND